MVQQDYFSNIRILCLKKCKKLHSNDLLTIVQFCDENFELEKFLRPENLPNGNTDLVTNEILKAIAQSTPFKKLTAKNNKNNTQDKPHRYFNFDIRLYRQVDYGINYLIENNVAPINDYNIYVENYSFYLSYTSLCKINDICEKEKEKEKSKRVNVKENEKVIKLYRNLEKVRKLNFSQNKQIYDTSVQSRLTEAFESLQNQHNFNLEMDTINYFVNTIIEQQNSTGLTGDMEDEFQKDHTILKLIKNCKNVEEINLNNLNLGDVFLKNFSIFISSGSIKTLQSESNKQNKPQLKKMILATGSNNETNGMTVITYNDLKGMNSEIGSPSPFFFQENSNLISSPMKQEAEITPTIKDDTKNDIPQEKAKKKDVANFNLNKLKRFKIRNNVRLTSVGLKYLFCSAVERRDITLMDLSYQGEVSSGITYFVNKGLLGMVDHILSESWEKLKRIYKKKGRFLKFLFNFISFKILATYFITFPFILFHFIEKTAKSWKSKTTKMLLEQGKNLKRSLSHRNSSKILDHEKTGANTPNNLSRASSFEKFEIDDKKKTEPLYRTTYTKCLKNLKKIKKNDKELEDQENEALFYFDKRLILVNDVMGLERKQNQIIKKNQVFNVGENNDDESRLSRFYLISKLRWIFLLNYIVYNGVSLGYLLYLKFIMNENADFILQYPYYIYGVVSYLVELLLCWEVVKIINNPKLISLRQMAMRCLVSQAARYDLFTDITFVLSVYDFDAKNNAGTYDAIFLASGTVLCVKLLIEFKDFIYFLENFFFSKKKKNQISHSTKFINSYSKLCFSFEFQGLGKLLDKFSTASAKKYTYFWLPKSLYNIYIPMIISATFIKLFFENIPQLIIQLFSLLRQTSNLLNFTKLSSLCSTVVSMILTMHVAWNARPSYFSRNLFKCYYDTLHQGKSTKNDKKSKKKVVQMNDSLLSDKSDEKNKDDQENKDEQNKQEEGNENENENKEEQNEENDEENNEENKEENNEENNEEKQQIIEEKKVGEEEKKDEENIEEAEKEDNF